MEIVTAGESHGKMLVGIISNIPAGLKIDFDFVNGELRRRMLGLGRSARMQIEDDVAEFVTGIRAGVSTGSPITALIANADYAAHKRDIGPYAEKSAKKLTAVRPGHADLAGAIKFATDDATDIWERASARNTAMTVALGAIAKLYLAELGVSVCSHTTGIGIVKAGAVTNYDDINARADVDRVRCLDKAASEKMVGEIRIAALSGDTLGGSAEIIVNGLKAGMGSFTSSEKRLDGMISGAVCAVPSVKAVEIGDGIAGAAWYGSAFHDEIFPGGKKGEYKRNTNRAGGIEGGMSNGMPIVVHAFFKPIPTLKSGLNTVDISTGKPAVASSERSDVCAVPSGGVVCEAAVAIAVARAVSDTLGGDTMKEVIARYKAKSNM